uniref:Uncharacterized protein n=1 Tax=Kalanchoe fedtschenkoi TaxID=63787 RepID=A0A7N0UAH0_KALFE
MRVESNGRKMKTRREVWWAALFSGRKRPPAEPPKDIEDILRSKLETITEEDDAEMPHLNKVKKIQAKLMVGRFRWVRLVPHVRDSGGCYHRFFIQRELGRACSVLTSF